MHTSTAKSRRHSLDSRRYRATPMAAVGIWPSAYQPVDIAKTAVGVAKAVGVGYADGKAVGLGFPIIFNF